jgi:hypothetical protein
MNHELRRAGTSVALLMIVPLQKHGDSVLVVTRKADTELMGFVAKSTLHKFFRHEPPMCGCVLFVERNLPAIEEILLRKSKHERGTDGLIRCVEVTAADLKRVGAGFAGIDTDEQRS